MDGQHESRAAEMLVGAARAVISAGRQAVRSRVGREFAVRRKSKGNYVTDVDLAIETQLKRRLEEVAPEVGFVAEESAPQVADGECWTIDPIDGTGNYLVGLPFTTAVAYMRDASHAIIGLVYDPQQDVLWWARESGGAYRLRCASECDISGYDMLRGSSERVALAEMTSGDGNVLFGMPYDRRKAHRILGYAERLFDGAGDLKRIGPASLDICRVAEGQAKLYIELDLKVWDYAAAELVLREAGGSALHRGDVSLFGSKGEIDAALEIIGGVCPG